jgi:hypothetical protein
MAGIRLHDQDDAAREVNARLDSHRWWVFVGSSATLSRVEERFYSGAAGADFEIMTGPPAGPFRDLFPTVRILLLAFAHKRRMTAAQLACLLRDGGASVTAEELEQRDVFFVEEAPAA